MPETELKGPELDMSVKCSVKNDEDLRDHSLNFTLLEPRRGAKSLAAGLRLQGLDITIWYKVSFPKYHRTNSADETDHSDFYDP